MPHLTLAYQGQYWCGGRCKSWLFTDGAEMTAVLYTPKSALENQNLTNDGRFPVRLCPQRRQ